MVELNTKPFPPSFESDLEKHSQAILLALSEVRKRVVGQSKMLERLMLAILLDSHVLLEGVPGLAKTTAIKTLAHVLGTRFNRVQFTPDLLPSDIIGTQIYNPADHSFSVKTGPIFCNLLLADEINRAPAKVQSALLEAMQERQVTIGNTTFTLERPFTVLATQNPIEQEGTYALPEAQVDRFLFKVLLDYPTVDEEFEIIQRMTAPTDLPLHTVLHPSDLLTFQACVRHILVDPRIDHYIVRLITATRNPSAAGLADLAPFIQMGASPRASINLHLASQGLALMRGRSYVSPQDIKDLAHDVLRHRVALTYEAEAENKTPDDIVTHILENIEVP